MQIKKIFVAPQFQKNWQKLPKRVKKKAIKQEKLFRQDAFHPSLHTHKLAGKLANYWSFRIDYHTRIVFRFLSQNEILFVDTGSHDIYK